MSRSLKKGAFVDDHLLKKVDAANADTDRKVMEKYGAYGEKMMYGKPVTGVIRSTVWVGADGKVRKHWAKVPKAETHPAAVLAALAAG